jgi:hypothetical protein
LDCKNHVTVTKILASGSPSRAPAQNIQGREIFPVFDVVLDGDDMTLELVTGLNEGEEGERVVSVTIDSIVRVLQSVSKRGAQEGIVY